MTYPPINHCSGGSPDRHRGGPGAPGAGAGAGAGSVYQLSYRSPQGLTDYDHRMPTTRFGSTFTRAAAVGVGKLPPSSCTSLPFLRRGSWFYLKKHLCSKVQEKFVFTLAQGVF